MLSTKTFSFDYEFGRNRCFPGLLDLTKTKQLLQRFRVILFYSISSESETSQYNFNQIHYDIIHKVTESESESKSI